jgi:hypothetical protein
MVIEWPFGHGGQELIQALVYAILEETPRSIWTLPSRTVGVEVANLERVRGREFERKASSLY